MTRCSFGLYSLVLMVGMAGCSSETAVETPAATAAPDLVDSPYLLTESPTDPQDVIPMRESIEDDQDVVVVGRIGGPDPWVDGMAAFSLVDRSLAACSDIPGDNCPTPWDYCCVTDKLPAATTFVKVVDDQGEIVPTSAQELLGVKELQTVVIKGKAHKDEAGNITVLASGIYVDPSNPGQVKRDGAGHDHPHTDRDDHQHEGEALPHDATADGPATAEGEQ